MQNYATKNMSSTKKLRGNYLIKVLHWTASTVDQVETMQLRPAPSPREAYNQPAWQRLDGWHPLSTQHARILTIDSSQSEREFRNLAAQQFPENRGAIIIIEI